MIVVPNGFVNSLSWVVASASADFYQQFLRLARSRLEQALELLELPAAARAGGLSALLVPVAVDAILLGADGLYELAHAIAEAGPEAELPEIEHALRALYHATEALNHGDESGARVNEGDLKQLAESLRARRVVRGENIHEENNLGSTAQSQGAALGEGADAEEAVWQPNLPPDLVDAFLDECGERLDGLSERLIELEGRGDDRELIGEIFRDLHTLKGSSAFAGLKKMNQVAHLAEDRIGELRDGKRAVSRSLIDVLLATLDSLRAMLDLAKARLPIHVETGSLLRRLQDPERARGEEDSIPSNKLSGVVGASARSPSPNGEEGERAAAVAVRAGPQATLRIDFEKVDRLLNLVGEVVLARGRLTGAADIQASVVRELGQLRQKSTQQLSSARQPARGSQLDLPDELQRAERVLRETHSDLDSSLSALGLAVSQLRDDVMKLRMVPISRLFSKYQRTVRELSNRLGKRVQVELRGAETELDKVLVERLEDPLLHLVRNAVDHGVELPEERVSSGKQPEGRLVLSASQRGGQIVVVIQDDGRGMDPARLREKALEKGVLTAEQARELSDAESYQLIFQAGFSTASQISDVSGRGVGMDVVRDAITKLKGSIHLDSQLGRGTTLELRLPLTLAITQILVARAAGELLALPLEAVASAQALGPEDLEVVGRGYCLRYAGELIPVIDLGVILGIGAGASSGALGDGAEQSVIIVELGTDRFGLLVQQVLGRHEVVIKSLGPLLAGTPCAAGATLVGDRILLVVDLAEVISRSKSGSPVLDMKTPLKPGIRSAQRGAPRVLIAEDSDTIREAIRRELSAAGFEVVAAPDGAEALRLANEELFDAVSTDVMMPRMDGYELTRRLRMNPRYAAVPIVMVTSKDARLDMVRGMDAGASAYITKPADAAELVRALDSLLMRREP